MFTSQAQKKKFEKLEAEGKLKKGTTKEWEAKTKDIAKLPERKAPTQKAVKIKVIARRKSG